MENGKKQKTKIKRRKRKICFYVLNSRPETHVFRLPAPVSHLFARKANPEARIFARGAGDGAEAAAGFALYDVQIVIGITADAYAKDVYTNEETLDIVNEQTALLETLDGYVIKLQQLSSVSGADKDSLIKISACIEKLNATAEALAAYVNDPSDENVDAFQAKRNASYNMLSDLLGLEN